MILKKRWLYNTCKNEEGGCVHIIDILLINPQVYFEYLRMRSRIKQRVSKHVYTQILDDTRQELVEDNTDWYKI